MDVKFWGVRGTFPSTGSEFSRYGGDTMCIEVTCGSTRLVLDAGSGLRALGAAWNATEGPVAAHLVLSHLHLDHLLGLPHFAPFWREDTRVVIHVAKESIEEDGDALLSVLRPPLFPLDAGALPATIEVQEYPLGGMFQAGPGVLVRTQALNHQGACAAIIVEAAGRKLAYVTDHEHGLAAADRGLTEMVAGSDLLIYDATFTDDEMATHRGWGHSSWQEGVRLQQRAGVGLLALAHHHPDRTDQALDALAEAASRAAANVFFARQGCRFSL